MVLIVSAGMLFLCRRNRISAGLALLTAAALIADSLQKASEIKTCSIPTPAASFTIYSHNVLYDGPVTKELARTVAKLAPDIIALQEYNTAHVDSAHSAIAALGYKAFVNDKPPAEGPFALAVYSKLPLRNHKLVITEGPDWKPNWPFQYIEFYFDGVWIKMANVHLIPPQRPGSGLLPYPPQQKYIPGQIDEVLRTIGEGDSPSIILGDFNQTPASKYHSYFQCKYNDSWLDAGCGFGFTWHNPYLFFRIDYILHSSHLRTVRIKTINNDYSDHRGLFAEMVLTR